MANPTKVPKNIVAEAVAQERAADAKAQRSQEQLRREIAMDYRSRPKMPVQISPMYRPYFGNNMAVIINGVSVYVPCDGKRYEVPNIYAAEIQRRIDAVDNQLLREQRSANKAVFEHSPGDIDIFQS